MSTYYDVGNNFGSKFPGYKTGTTSGNMQGPENSYKGLKGRFGGMTDQVFKGFQNFGSNGFGGGSGGGYGFNFGYPAPNDPMVKGYMGNLQGGARNMVNDAVSRMAYAGPNRAGTGVVGGPDARASLSHGAISSIARLYPELYDQSMGYGAKLYGAGADAFKTYASLIPSMMNAELGAAGGESGHDLSVFGTLNTNEQRALDFERQQQAQQNQYMREDALDARNYARGAADRSFQEDQRNQQKRGWYEAAADRAAKMGQLDRDRAAVTRQNSLGQGAGWDRFGDTTDAAMRLAAAEGRDWWRDPARGGGGGASKGGGGDTRGASWEGFSRGLVGGLNA